jgi:transposase
MDKAIKIVAGIDVGDETSYVHAVDVTTGEVVWDGRVGTTAGELRHLLRPWGRARIALEVGTHSPWLQELLEGLGHEVLVANARKLRCIFESTNKQDRLDAQMLAEVAAFRPSLLHPIRHRQRKTREDLAVLRARRHLVRMRAEAVQVVRGMVKSHGGRVPACDTEAFARRAREGLPAGLVAALGPLLETIEGLTRRIEAFDEAVERMAGEKYPEVRALTEVPGVGTLTALCFVLTLEDPARFRKSRDVAPALGLVPRRDQSGATDKHLPITKTGDEYLRSLLVESAHCVLRRATKPSDLKDWGRKLASHGGKAGKRRAVVAVARKLGVLLHRLWVTQAAYERYRTTGKARRAA